eukprot:437985-Amorphochlora_amoeboformis.AAC.1
MSAIQGMMDNQALTKKEQKEIESMMQDMMFREMQEVYIGLVDRCFNKCVNNFRSRKVQSSEKECIKNCVAKSIAHTKRVQMRFTEQNQKLNAQMQAGAAGGMPPTQ